MTRIPIVMVLSAVVATLPAHAQETVAPELRGRPADRPDEWEVSLRGALILTPSWTGSDDMSLSLVPDIRVTYGDEIFASIPEGLGWNAIKGDGWKIGPLAKIRFGRDEDDGGSPFLIAGGSDDLQGMGDIDPSAELGGFVEKSFGPRSEWTARVEVLKGFGGHDGAVGYGSLDYRTRLGNTIVSFGPRINIVSGDFMDTYYGIDAQQSADTGLAPYRAEGGILSYGVGANAVQPLNRRSAITVFAVAEDLGSEARRSPLVEERGQRLQFALGVGYGYRFGL
ncbi:MipA/OmpV family protein [Croceicoccus sp. Ery5]|uniref:MipA/OmpV family protein n=1 Tax=Croceicoccus sp. Ery5 TaxID=1703340 RepID=UPI001E45080B|nr:MipA/OmpV family protein [Croceicoccus sp. Ery5]